MADTVTLPVVDGIPQCWVVWAMKPGDLRLVAVCSSQEIADRYVEQAVSLFPDHRLAAENAPVDHLFGGSDLRSVAFRASIAEARRGRLPSRLRPPPRPNGD